MGDFVSPKICIRQRENFIDLSAGHLDSEAATQIDIKALFWNEFYLSYSGIMKALIGKQGACFTDGMTGGTLTLSSENGEANFGLGTHGSLFAGKIPAI